MHLGVVLSGIVAERHCGMLIMSQKVRALLLANPREDANQLNVKFLRMRYVVVKSVSGFLSVTLKRQKLFTFYPNKFNSSF